MPDTYSATNVVKLLEQLVSIPSYVDATHNESRLVMFLMDFFKENLPSLTVEQQFIDKDSVRSNLLIKGKKPAKLFVLGHIDTVRPNDNWSTNPIMPTISDGRLYGLGAADMKGSLAAFLSALMEEKDNFDLDELMVLLYCDEEYDFAGVKRFIKTQQLSATPPELIISLDGSLALSSGCRGLVEFNAQVTGKSGHSSNPSNGRNVITGVSAAVGELGDIVARYSDEYLGASTVNLAYLQGGTIEHESKKVYWQREGNVIPDYAEVTVELRPADETLDADRAVLLFRKECEKRNLSVQSISIRHDLRPWPVSYDSDKIPLLEKWYELADIEFSKMNRKYSGFIDVQMITEIVDTPAFVIGAGGENKHGADESVSLDDLTSTVNLYRVILTKSMGK